MCFFSRPPKRQQTALSELGTNALCKKGVPVTPDNIGSECPVNQVVNITKGLPTRKRKEANLPYPKGIRDAFAEAYGLIRLGEAGVDAFTIMKLAGHSVGNYFGGYIRPTGERRGCIR